MSGTLHPAPSLCYSPADVAIIAAEVRGRWLRWFAIRQRDARCLFETPYEYAVRLDA